MKIHKLLSSVLLSFTCLTAYSQVSGIVFRDFNANGLRDSSATFFEPRVAGITVKAYDATNTEVASTTSNALGQYAFTGLTLPVRVEFSGIQSFDYSGPRGTGNATSVQFYSVASTTANFAVNYPTEYSQANPKVAVVKQQQGTYVSTGISTHDESIVTVNYDNTTRQSLTKQFDGGTTAQFGTNTIYGLAYDRKSKLLYSSAFLKRHTLLRDINNDGFGDLGNIYVTNTATAVTTLWKDLTTLGINFGSIVNNAGRGLSTTSFLSYDPLGFQNTGKMGIGDIDISDDGSTMYLTNLFDKKLYAIDMVNQTLIASWTIPQSCSNSDVCNFGLKCYKGIVFIGQVCTGETSQSKADLTANVIKFDGTNFSTVLQFPLNYQKGLAYNQMTCSFSRDYNPWSDSIKTCMSNNPLYPPYPCPVKPEAMLTDIEIDPGTGNLLIGMRDRNGDKTGNKNYVYTSAAVSSATGDGMSSGEILIASLNSDGTYTIETNGKITGYTGSGVGNAQGIGGGEFFGTDNWSQGTTQYHQEVGQGALAIFPGKRTTVSTSMDPLLNDSGGFKVYSNVNGTAPSGFQVYRSDDNTVFGKANGLGDLELLVDPAPLEIGNRVWVDTNGNGIQDAGEAALAGVTVQLLNAAGTVLATATTDANGNYIFSSATGTSTAPFRYGLAIATNTSYTVRVPNVQGGTKQVALGANLLTASNADNSNGDVRDSDGTMAGDNADIVLVTGGFGANNHTYDFGFSTILPCTSTTTATAGTCDPATNQYAVSGQVTLTNPPASGTVTVQVVGGGSQTFTLPQTSPIAYSIAGQTADGASHTVNVSISGVSCASTVTYTAPTSCAAAACVATITAIPGGCDPANNQYAVSGQVTLTNPPASGTVTVQITGGGSQTFTLPQTSPFAYNIAGQTADGGNHTITVSISGVSCTNSTTYDAPFNCSMPCPTPNCFTMKSFRIINN